MQSLPPLLTSCLTTGRRQDLSVPVSSAKWGETAAVLMWLLRTEMVPARSLAWLKEYHLSLIASGSWQLLLNP